MWPFRRKNKVFGVNKEVQFLLDHGWHKFANGAWGHEDRPAFFTFRQAMQHVQVAYETQQARERFKRNIHLYDPNSFIGRIIRAFRLIFRMK